MPGPPHILLFSPPPPLTYIMSSPTPPHPSSDGAGRSGVFLAIDANIELAEEDGLFDIYGYLKKIRQARRGLIETVVSTPRTGVRIVSDTDLSGCYSV